MNQIRNDYKILFISINDVWRYGNIGMDQLLGFLRKRDFNIDIQYFYNKRATIEKILQKIGTEYDMYAFSVNVSNYEKCIRIAENLKEHNKTVVFGGGYPTKYYREIFSSVNVVDYITIGDGEFPSEYLYNQLAISKATGEKTIISHTSVATPTDMKNKKEYFNTLIDWEPAYDYYLKYAPEENSRKVHCIQIKNNICTGNCTFCTERHGKVTYKKIEDIVNQIEYVYQNYGVKKFYFTDDNILDPNTQSAKEHLKKLCLSLKDKHLKAAYQCYIKAFSIEDNAYDNELLALMHEIGFTEVFVGVEAGNESDLKLYNKLTTVKQNYEVIKLLRRYDIFPIIGYIAFNPYSSKETISTNFNYLCDISCTYLHNYLHSFVIINKYTAMYEMIKRDGLLLSDNTQYLDVDYNYSNTDIKPVLDYVKESMLPRLRCISYDLDWVTYSMLEHEIWYDNITDYREILKEKKNEDLNWIKKYLSILFIDFDVNKFKSVEEEFWEYFRKEEIFLKKIYKYYVSLHNTSSYKE